MKRGIAFLLVAWLSAMSCAQLDSLPEGLSLEGLPFWKATEPPNFITVVSDGRGILTSVGGQDLGIILDPKNVLDTSNVLVTAINLGDKVFLETYDPSVRFLPTVQVVDRSENEFLRLQAQQVEIGDEWMTMRSVGILGYQRLHPIFLSTVTLESLHTFLITQQSGAGVNLLLELPKKFDNQTHLAVFSTVARGTFVIQAAELEVSSSGAVYVPAKLEPSTAIAVSLTTQALESTAPIDIFLKAQRLGAGGVIEPPANPTDESPAGELEQ